MTRSTWTRLLRLWGLPCGWCVLAFFMFTDWYSNPPDPTLSGTDAYGTNQPGALRFGIIASLIELGVVLAMLRPWAEARVWPWEVGAWVLVTSWLAVSMFLSMHGGGVVFLHLVWVGVLKVWISAHLLSLFFMRGQVSDE